MSEQSQQTVIRWKHDALGHMTTEPDGGYVDYTDYLALQQRCEQVESEVVRLVAELEEQRRLKEQAEAQVKCCQIVASGASLLREQAERSGDEKST